MRLRLVLLVLSAVMLGAPVVSFAEAPLGGYTEPTGLTGHRAESVCPPRPVSYAGADESVAVLVYLAQELADNCATQQLLAVQAHTDAGAITTRLGESLSVMVGGEPTVKVSNLSEAATGGTVELSAEAKKSLSESGVGGAVYLAGAMFALLCLVLLYKAVLTSRSVGS